MERTSRAKLNDLSPDRSTEMLRMREKLTSMHVESRQAVATSWLSLQAQECLCEGVCYGCSCELRVFVLGAPLSIGV